MSVARFLPIPPHQHLIRELPKLDMQLAPAASFLLASLQVRGFLARDQPEDGWEAVGGRCWPLLKSTAVGRQGGR